MDNGVQTSFVDGLESFRFRKLVKNAKYALKLRQLTEILLR